MKKTALLSLLLVCLLSLSACSGILDFLNAGIFQNSHTTASPGPAGPIEPSVTYVEDPRSYGYYYDQLDDNAKSIYRTIYADSLNASGIDIALKYPVSVSGALSDAEALKAELGNLIKDVVQPALDALIFDHPEVFWISMGDSTFTMSLRQKEADGRITFSVSVLTFKLAFKDGLTAAAIREKTAMMKDAVTRYPEKSGSRYGDLLAIHGRLVESVMYDSGAPNAHDAIGALIDGRAVCDGYARAFKLLCDSYGIPCVIVVGSATQNGKADPHAWNYVEMEDGKWYAIDATWNDSGNEPSRNYFLIGSGTIISSHDPSLFSESHTPSGKFSGAVYEPFRFPLLSEDNYIPTVH